MVDIAQVLATYDALVGVALGAGLTYGFGALNRRHQEKRENDTRWYEKRFQAYVALYQAAWDGYFSVYGSAANPSAEDLERASHSVINALGEVHFVGSPEVAKAAEKVLDEVLQIGKKASADFLDDVMNAVEAFQEVARKDLGHPSP
jgi:hypothetical protein